MVATQQEMFAKPKRAKPLKRAHAIDAGEGMAGYPFGASFKCARCNWESNWICFDNQSEIRRGLPCPNCNEGKIK